MAESNDDMIDNIMGDKDFGNDIANPSSGPDNESSSSIADYQVFDDNDELVAFRCARVLENNPGLEDIPLFFYIDLKFPKGGETLAIRRVQTGLLLAIARDFRITTGKACTDPPPNGISWLVSIRSEVGQLKKETTFPKCRELTFDQKFDDCFVYEFQLTGNVLTGKKMPDVQAVVETLFVNQVEKSLDSSFEVQFLGIPKYEDGADDKPLINPPSKLEGSEMETKPVNRQSVTIVGGFLVAAFCMATVGILLILWQRRKKQHRIERERLSPSKHFSPDTEEEKYRDQEVPAEHLYPLDLSNTFNKQVFGAHQQNGNNGRGTTRYLSNVNANQGPYSHFHRREKSRFASNGNQIDILSESDADSWAQADGTIGSLELQLEPITAREI